MKKTALILFLIASLKSIAQDKIVYDVGSNLFLLNGKQVDKNALLKKNTDYQIALKNFNPFVYTPTIDVKAKDDLKDFFEFLTKLNKVSIKDVTDLIATTIDVTDRSTAKKKAFLVNYNDAFKINQDLKLNTFNYLDLKSRLKNEQLNLLSDYLLLKQELETSKPANTTIDSYMTSLGIPSQTDVMALDLQMKDLNSFLNKHDATDQTFPISSFSSGLFTKITINVKLTPKTEFAARYSETSKTHIFNVKSAIIVNFSSGIYITSNPERKYYSIKGTNGKYTIGEESERNFLPGVAVLGHILYANEPNIGIVVGAGVDIETTANVLLGICYKPKNSNILLSTGVGFSYQKKLSDALNTHDEYNDNPTLSYKDIMELGYWFGISYKIF